MFSPSFQISQPLLATIKDIAVQVYVLNKQRPTTEAVTALEEETQTLVAAAIGRGDEQETLNYGRTLAELGSKPAADFNLALLLRIHFRLSSGLLPDDQRGRLRRDGVGANGGPLSVGLPNYQPPEPKAVPVMLNDLVSFVEECRAMLDPLLLAGIFHRQLLLISPFAGGNQRTAWLATRILLSGLGLERFDLLTLEDRFHQDKDGYLDALGVRGQQDGRAGMQEFTPWLEYFVDNVAVELSALEERYRQHRATPATRLQPHHQALLAYVDENGYITDKQYATLTDRAKATRSLDFKKLLEMELLVREGRGRSTYYRRKT